MGEWHKQDNVTSKLRSKSVKVRSKCEYIPKLEDEVHNPWKLIGGRLLDGRRSRDDKRQMLEASHNVDHSQASRSQM